MWLTLSHTRYYGPGLLPKHYTHSWSIFCNLTTPNPLLVYRAPGEIKFSKNKEVKQGCNLSPLYVSLFINGLHINSPNSILNSTFPSSCLNFTDNIVLFYDEPGKLQELINLCTSIGWSLTWQGQWELLGRSPFCQACSRHRFQILSGQCPSQTCGSYCSTLMRVKSTCSSAAIAGHLLPGLPFIFHFYS